MKISDFDYNLDQEKIAKYPPKVRGESRLLVLNKSTGEISDRKYADIVDYIDSGDILILNDTKVIKARLIAHDSEGREIEIFILEKHADDDKKVLLRGKAREGAIYKTGEFEIKIKEIFTDGTADVESETELYKIAEAVGEIPIPPYMKRSSEKSDEERYQTVFGTKEGSVAAPTASLNFTEELKNRLLEKGVIIKYMTLHVGLGTFLPIRSDDVEDHIMHSEYFIIPKDTIDSINKAKKNGKKIITLGTTVTRAIEYSAEKIALGNEIKGEANIFIYPGYRFKVIDKLITNFHAPRSTVLMLASAFAGWNNLKNAYEHALRKDYRFLSYGDSMIIQ